MALPLLREELTLHPGPPTADGEPTWSLQDPVRHSFYRIDWPTFLILSHWHLGDPEAICSAVMAEAPLDLEAADVEAVADFLIGAELVCCDDAGATRRLHRAESLRAYTPWRWLLHHYLFFRIPLLRPDAWLQRMQPWVRPLFSPTFFKLTLAALVFGLFGISRQWQSFTATLVDTFSWEGMAGYAMTLVLAKMLHELGHAFTAKRAGCRVPTMGIAFLVMWPVAYTDVNDAWKLPDRRSRLAIGAAGIVTELTLAAWASLAWTALPDGPLRTAAFLMATTTWVATVLINASPFMRFDGYFLLSDWLDIPNLHARTFALARWRLRETLFALDEPRPEIFTPGRERFLIAFAWATWLYRLFLFVGIAVLVYQYFFKALGVFLFLVEIGWFILQPLRNELLAWRQRWPQIRTRRRSRVSLAAAGALAALCFMPWDWNVRTQALLKPVQSLVIYAPAPGRLEIPLPPAGSPITASQPVLRLTAPDLERRDAIAAARLARVQRQIEVAGVDTANRSDLQVLQEARDGLLSEREGIAAEQARLTVAAPFSGRFLDPLPGLSAGDWVGRNQRIATLAADDRWQVDTYLEEQDIARIALGDGASFFAEVPGGPVLHLKVINIDRDASRILIDPILASTHGGNILVRPTKGGLVPEHAVYRVTLATDEVPPADYRRNLRGRLVIHGAPRSLLGHYLRTLLAALIRESAW